MEKVYISIGSNLGDKLKTINSSIEMIDEYEIAVTSISPFYITEPWGNENQNNFLNCVVEIETYFSPWKLLNMFQKIELSLGKDIKVRWGERTIDIDIVLFGEKIIYEKNLIIPHPRYHKRNFVLIPLCDISKDIIDPISKNKIELLLELNKDKNKVKLLK